MRKLMDGGLARVSAHTRYEHGLSGVISYATSAQTLSRPIRVAVVMGRMMGGGVESTVMNHYRHLDHSRVQFDFVVDADATVIPREEIKALGGRVFIVPPYKQLPEYMNACRQLFERIRPDIVHSHLNALSVFPLRAAKLAGVPVRIAHSHSTSNPHEHLRHLAKNVLRPFSRVYATHYAACSEFAARWLFGDRLVDSGQVYLMRNALDLAAFAFDPRIRTSKRAELGCDGVDSAARHQLVVGQVGRLSSQKNQLFTERVFAKLLRRQPDALLVFAGDGPQHDDARRLARDLGIEQRVRFLGVRSDVPELYQAFDVLAFPSLYEGLGMAAIEAQSAGLPVVASTEVPQEACLVPGVIERKALEDGEESWADALISAAGRVSEPWSEPELGMKPQLGSEEGTANYDRRPRDVVQTRATERVGAAGYEIRASAERLCAQYESLVAEALR